MISTDEMQNGDRLIFCKMCDQDRVHMDLQLPGNVRWKCKRCGEYNKPKFDTVAEEILDPVEIVYTKLPRK